MTTYYFGGMYDSNGATADSIGGATSPNGLYYIRIVNSASEPVTGIEVGSWFTSQYVNNSAVPAVIGTETEIPGIYLVTSGGPNWWSADVTNYIWELNDPSGAPADPLTYIPPGEGSLQYTVSLYEYESSQFDGFWIAFSDGISNGYAGLPGLDTYASTITINGETVRITGVTYTNPDYGGVGYKYVVGTDEPGFVVAPSIGDIAIYNVDGGDYRPFSNLADSPYVAYYDASSISPFLTLYDDTDASMNGRIGEFYVVFSGEVKSVISYAKTAIMTDTVFEITLDSPFTVPPQAGDRVMLTSNPDGSSESSNILPGDRYLVEQINTNNGYTVVNISKITDFGNVDITDLTAAGLAVGDIFYGDTTPILQLFGQGPLPGLPISSINGVDIVLSGTWSETPVRLSYKIPTDYGDVFIRTCSVDNITDELIMRLCYWDYAGALKSWSSNNSNNSGRVGDLFVRNAERYAISSVVGYGIYRFIGTYYNDLKGTTFADFIRCSSGLDDIYTIESISVADGNTTISIRRNAVLITNTAGQNHMFGNRDQFYFGDVGLSISSSSGSEIVLTGEWYPAPEVGAKLGLWDPIGTIYVDNPDYNEDSDNEYTITLSYYNPGFAFWGDVFTGQYDGTVNVGDTFMINEKSYTVIEIQLADGVKTYKLLGANLMPTAIPQGTYVTIIKSVYVPPSRARKKQYTLSDYNSLPADKYRNMAYNKMYIMPEITNANASWQISLYEPNETLITTLNSITIQPNYRVLLISELSPGNEQILNKKVTIVILDESNQTIINQTYDPATYGINSFVAKNNLTIGKIKIKDNNDTDTTATVAIGTIQQP